MLLPILSTQVPHIQQVIVSKPAQAAPKPITHPVLDGETLTSIADAHSTSVLRLWAANTQLSNPDLIEPGMVLNVPQNTDVLADRPMPVSIVMGDNLGNGNVGASPSSAKSSFSVSGNLYTPGNCTWAVKNWRPELPNNLGNADSWFSQAAADGLAVGYTPRVGAVGVAVGYMHVVIIRAVHSTTVDVIEMNYRGLYIVSTRTAPISEFRYIY